jgi:hypothetical protein
MSHAADRPASRLAATLERMKLHASDHMSPDDLAAFGRTIDKAKTALVADSILAAIKTEDAHHIAARIEAVTTQANALLVTAEYLVHLAQDLRRDLDLLREATEGSDDTEY